MMNGEDLYRKNVQSSITMRWTPTGLYIKNPEMKEPEGYAYVPWRTILLQAAKDLNSTGIVINPYSGHQAYVWVSPVYIRKIIQRAAMIMEDALKTFGEEPEKETQSSPLTSEKMDDLEDFSVDDLSNIDLDDDP